MRKKIKWFANEMEKVLSNNDYKGGWEFEDYDYLFDRLRDEYIELRRELKKGDENSSNILKECVDVANFSMMIADVIISNEKE